MSCVGQVSTTLTSGASHLVPVLLYRERLQGALTRWTEFRQRWPSIEASLEKFHVALGGSSLAEFRAILFDDRLQAADTNTEGAGRRAAQREILRRLDPDPSYGRFLDFLGAAEADPWAAIPSDLGSWTTAAIARGLALRSRADASGVETKKVAWALLRAPVTLDGGVHEPLEPLAATAESRVSLASIRAAEIAMKGSEPRQLGWDADPWVPAARALAKEGLQYSGLAHMEVAAALDAAGREQEAWSALISAAHWTQMRTRNIVPAIREAARFLAETHQWPHVIERLSQ